MLVIFHQLKDIVMVTFLASSTIQAVSDAKNSFIVAVMAMKTIS